MCSFGVYLSSANHERVHHTKYSDKFMRQAFYHNLYVLNFFSEKQIFEARTFDIWGIV